jgi:N-acetylmuramoyl-L-alanine amidase
MALLFMVMLAVRTRSHNPRAGACLALLALVVCACAPLPQRTQLPVAQRPSANFNERRPNFVILHHTGSVRAERALATLRDPAREVSAHYLVARDGRIYYLVDELARAWHAGASYCAGHRDMNSASLGIELDNDGHEPYAEAQMESLLALLADVKARYSIPSANFIGHADVAPQRKADPGRHFPWQRLAERGFGLWCEPPFPPAPPALDTAMLLSAFGYDVSDADAAVMAFKRHFAPAENLRGMSEEDRARLWCLVLRKASGRED